MTVGAKCVKQTVLCRFFHFSDVAFKNTWCCEETQSCQEACFIYFIMSDHQEILYHYQRLAKGCECPNWENHCPPAPNKSSFGVNSPELLFGVLGSSVEHSEARQAGLYTFYPKIHLYLQTVFHLFLLLQCIKVEWN